MNPFSIGVPECTARRVPPKRKKGRLIIIRILIPSRPSFRYALKRTHGFLSSYQASIPRFHRPSPRLSLFQPAERPSPNLTSSPVPCWPQANLEPGLGNTWRDLVGGCQVVINPPTPATQGGARQGREVVQLQQLLQRNYNSHCNSSCSSSSSFRAMVFPRPAAPIFCSVF